jgi:type I restriction enzyme S subunit
MELKTGYKQTEVGIIPDGWEVCSVESKGEVVTGKALAANALGKHRPYLRTKNVFDGKIDINDVLTMPMTDDQFHQFGLQRGDVLLNEGQSLELVGRCAMYQDEYPEPCAIQNQLIRFRAKAGVSGEFASYVFRHCQQSGIFARIALQTTSIAHLGGSRFQRLRLTWPKSEKEQRAIAEALSDVDALLAALDRLLTKKRDLKQVALQQLLTGQTRLPGFSEEWEIRVLGQGVTLLSGQHVLAKYCNSNGSGVPYLTGPSDFPSGVISRTKFTERPTTLCCARDILITVKGSGVGSMVVADRTYCISRQLMAVRVSNGWDATFIYFALLRDSALIGATATGLIPGVSRADLLSKPLSMPVLGEQCAIAEVLTDMDSEIVALEQRRDKTRALKQGMMQELLTGRIRLV